MTTIKYQTAKEIVDECAKKLRALGVRDYFILANDPDSNFYFDSKSADRTRLHGFLKREVIEYEEHIKEGVREQYKPDLEDV